MTMLFGETNTIHKNQEEIAPTRQWLQRNKNPHPHKLREKKRSTTTCDVL